MALMVKYSKTDSSISKSRGGGEGLGREQPILTFYVGFTIGDRVEMSKTSGGK